MSKKKQKKLSNQELVKQKNLKEYKEFTEKFTNLLRRDYTPPEPPTKNQVRNTKRKRLTRKKKEGKFTESPTETTIRRALEALKVTFHREYEFEDLKNPNTGHPLRFDFYLPYLKICIEYDGRHHFEYVEKYHKTPERGIKFLKDQKFRDSLKDKFCLEKNLKLIRLNYKDYKKLSSRVKEEIKKVFK